MRRWALFVIGGAFWLLLLAVPVLADNGPHVKNQAAQAAIGSCAGCHRAHSGQAPDLLKSVMPTLCYTCHNGAGANTNVVDGVGYTETNTALRGGGFDYALIDTAVLGPQPGVSNAVSRVANVPVTTSHATSSTHSVNGSPQTMWGSGALGSATVGKANVDLTCGSCHDPHGNGQYRILKVTPSDVEANPAVAGVKINDATTKLYTTDNYGQQGQFAADAAESPLNADGSALSFNTADKMFSGTYLEASSRWCATCHTRYFAQSGAAGNKDWTVAGSADATFKFRHATRNIVDPTSNGAPTTGVITPISSFSQLKAGATIGSYTATSSGQVFTYRGVAVLGTASGLNSAAAAGDNLSTGAPRCITCHVGHGSNATAGARTTAETSIVTGNSLGSTLLRLDGRTVCQACHAK